MPSEARLSPKDRRRVLKLLSRDRLAELTDHFELEVADRRSTDAHVDAIVRKKSLDFRALLERLRREELQEVCAALALDTGGREKAKLVDRILGVKEPTETAAAPALSSEPPRSGTSSFPPPSMRGGSAVKSLLRRFVIRTAAEYLGRDASAKFTARLLGCFGWPASGPPDAAMPGSLAVVEAGKRTTREVALSWPARRVLVDVVKHDVMLDYAWKDLLRVCLQVDPPPQYVVLTNQRDVHLYDLARDREAPRLTIALDDLPKYSEAFPFLSASWVPGTVPTIINVSKVSGEVAGLVAKLYRSLKEQHPKRERDVVQFTLQCILAMFAEDIGLLPQQYFTTLLYDGARHRDAEKRLAELFRLMSTRDVPDRAVAYFNGGLFTNPVTLPLGDVQLTALTKASEANWKYVDPHIFGSVFQGIMNDAERHKSGAHYTAHEDIMRVVGPTIVEPWRKRIREASTLTELLEVRKELLAFRVLDPACGSGNFLYVAFRELYRLETELLARIREFPSTTDSEAPTRVSWGAGIHTSQFFGIDINPFAVELAKVTLNIAKKIAFDERRDTGADLFGQVEIDLDPSLPLDNLDENIVRADALFMEWPMADAIVGNPPFLGGSKIRRELGVEYLRKLEQGVGSSGIVDLACYWFRMAHDRLAPGARAGLVATSGIRVGKQREASLDYIVANGGTITNAVSSREWPGDAAVNVSMVNWVRGAADGPFELLVEGEPYAVRTIPTHLQLHADAGSAKDLLVNVGGMTEGVNFGHEAYRSGSAGFPRDELGANRFVRPVATADDLLRGKLSAAPEVCAYFTCATEAEASATGGAAFEHLKKHVFPLVKGRAESGKDAAINESWLRRWWQPWAPRTEFFASLRGRIRLLVTPKVSSRPAFSFLSTRFVPTDTLKLFAFADDYAFGVLQSSLHWAWTRARGSRVTERIQYTSAVWRTFPWPQEPSAEEVTVIADASRMLRRIRDELMLANGWSLRALHQAAEVPGPHPLKDAQTALDEAVRRAYGMPDGQDATEFLLELNKLVAEDEAAGHAVQGPGLPRGFDPKDPRWTSDDCIEPPPAPGT